MRKALDLSGLLLARCLRLTPEKGKPESQSPCSAEAGAQWLLMGEGGAVHLPHPWAGHWAQEPLTSGELVSRHTHLLASSLFISSMRPPPPPPLLARLASDFEGPLGLEPPDASSG